MMILHETSGTSTIGRDKLAARVDAFARGRMERTSGRSIAPHTAIFQSHIDRGGGGQEKGPGGTSQDPERSSFQSKACAHGVSSSSKEQHNIRFVAREKTSADQGDPTKDVGIFTRTPSGVEPEDFHQVWLHKISLMVAHPLKCARH